MKKTIVGQLLSKPINEQRLSTFFSCPDADTDIGDLGSTSEILGAVFSGVIINGYNPDAFDLRLQCVSFILLT